LDIDQLLGGVATYPEVDGLVRDLSAQDMIAGKLADVIVEVSPTNLETAQPALDYCQLALDNGKHVVLANKGPVALAFHELAEKAKANGLELRCEATVMAGTPTMQLAQEALTGCDIIEARGILNGTTNYILTQMEQGMSYTDALAKAQELGYAETDPSGDVEGWDAAGKVLILSKALFGATYGMSALDVVGITGISEADIQDAQANGERYKLIATVTPQGGQVKPMRLPVSDPLASVGGATNAITIATDLMGDVTLIGAGAGQIETGFAILSDLLAIHRLTR
jgi:homoserine dehydrogenase